MSHSEEELKKFYTELGDPVGMSFDEETIKTRRNLVILSFIFIFYEYSGATIKAVESSGIVFDNFDLLKNQRSLFILAYLCHNSFHVEKF